MAWWKFVHFRMFRSTLTVQKLRRIAVQNSTVQNGGHIFGLYSGQFDRCGVNTISVLIFIMLRCVVTQLGDSILDLLKKRSAHGQMVNPLKKIKNSTWFVSSVWTEQNCWTVPCERNVIRSNLSSGPKFVRCRVNVALGYDVERWFTET